MLPRALAVWCGILVLASLNGGVRDLLLTPRLGDTADRAPGGEEYEPAQGWYYLFHKPWATRLADYDVRRGRIWIAVLVVTFVAPVWLSQVRHPGPDHAP